jgi:hypothetical protein
MTPPSANKPLSERNSFASIRVVRVQTWLAGVLILLLFPNAFGQSDFSAFWKEFKSAVIAGDKAKVVEMTKFQLSMPYGVKAVKNKQDFLRRYNEILRRGERRSMFHERQSAKRIHAAV